MGHCSLLREPRVWGGEGTFQSYSETKLRNIFIVFAPGNDSGPQTRGDVGIKLTASLHLEKSLKRGNGNPDMINFIKSIKYLRGSREKTFV